MYPGVLMVAYGKICINMQIHSFLYHIDPKIPKRVKYLRLISCLENGGIAQLPVPLLIVFCKANP